MKDARAWRSDIVRLIVFAAVLGAIAWMAPAPWNPTDRDDYEMVGRQMIVASCSSLHCFRMLVPIVIEHLPGPSIVKWKAYAALANALAAVAVLRLTLAFGLTMHAARLAAWLSLLGFGSLYTLFDPHTADPLMYFLGPALTLLLLRDRITRATIVAAGGVFGKEFAAAPLWIAAWANAIASRWGPMLRAGLAAASVTVLWLIFELTLVTVFDYSYGDNPPSTMFHGGYLAHWVGELGPRAAVVAVLTTFGAVYVLAPAGLRFAPVRLRQWTLACLPAVLAFCYVQQPDRALWNFHFVVMPLAALVLVRLPNVMAWGFVVAYAAANLRSGAQLPWVPSARLFLLLSTVAAIAAVVHVRRSGATADVGSEETPADLPVTRVERRRIPLVIAVNTIALIAASVVMLDASKHRQSEREFGVNKWGYRGTVMPPRRPDEARVAILGGEIAYGSRVPWEESFPFYLQRNMRQGWRKLYLDGASVINLATPVDGAGSFAATIDDYGYLQPDLFVFMTDSQHPAGDAGGWRRESAIFRKTGYLPLLTRPLWQTNTSAHAAASDPDALCEMVVAAVDMAVTRGTKALVVNAPARATPATNADDVLAARIASRFTDASRVRYLDLRRAIDFTDRKLSADGVTLTARGNDDLAERLTDRTLELIRQ